MAELDSEPLPAQFIFSPFEEPPEFDFHYNNTAPVNIYRTDTLTQGSIINRPKSGGALDLPCGPLTLKYCDDLLDRLLRHSDLSAFKKEVDPVRDGCPNYFSIIKEPMDLTTLQKRLRSGVIPNVAEFKRCLDLIWDNCETFNGETHPLAREAQSFRNAINLVWSKCSNPPPLDAIKYLEDMKVKLHRVGEIFEEILDVPPRPNIPPPPKVKPYVAPKITPVKVVEGPPTQMQRKQMADKFMNTPASELKEEWNIIRPYITQDMLTNKQFSLNDLPEGVLINLKKLMLK